MSNSEWPPAEKTFVVFMAERQRPVGGLGPYKDRALQGLWVISHMLVTLVVEGKKREDLRLSRLWVVPEGVDPADVRTIVEEWIRVRNLVYAMGSRLDDIDGAGMHAEGIRAPDLTMILPGDEYYREALEEARRAAVRMVALLKLGRSR